MGLFHSASPIVVDGLTFCLDPANKRSYSGVGTTISDYVGGVSGSFTSTPAYQEVGIGSLAFDGADDGIQFSSFPQLFSGSFTFSAWVYVEDFDARDIIFGSYSFSNNFNLEIANGRAMRFFWNNGQTNQYTYGNVTSTGWNYLTFMRERLSSTSSVVSMYRDATLAISVTSTAFSDITTPSTFYLARDTRIGGVPLYGKISLVTIYNRNLSGSEIEKNYEATVGRYT